MSLLIDALRRADEAKRAAARAGEAAAPGQEITLAPLDNPSAAPTRDELQNELTALDERPHKQAGAPPENTSAVGQGAARNLFEVKEADSRRGFHLVLGGFTLLALLAIGIYFWLQLQPSGGGLDATMPPRPADSTPVTATAVAPRIIPLDEPLPSAPLTRVDPPARPVDESSAAPRLRPRTPRTQDASRGSFGQTRTPTTPAARQSEPLHASIPIRRGTTTPAVPIELQQAWNAYDAGELEKAYGLYQAALSENSRSIDALNGLGAISLRVGDAAQATAWFRRTLRLEPDNAVALAGLSSVTPPTGAAEESRLRNLIAGQPEASALHFALGNLFASERRWNDAQQAYFDAYSLEPQNPDYRFNLAVSLDRLGQKALARRFYLEAAEIARNKPAAFDPATAQARAQALAPEPGK